VHETYRMLGREHEADLVREARRRELAAALPKRQGRDQVANWLRRLRPFGKDPAATGRSPRLTGEGVG
jgi:hypothetical protein